MTGIVPKFSRTPGGVSATGPKLGQHTRAVLADLAGVDASAFQVLLDSGLVSEPRPTEQTRRQVMAEDD